MPASNEAARKELKEEKGPGELVAKALKEAARKELKAGGLVGITLGPLVRRKWSSKQLGKN